MHTTTSMPTFSRKRKSFSLSIHLHLQKLEIKERKSESTDSSPSCSSSVKKAKIHMASKRTALDLNWPPILDEKLLRVFIRCQEGSIPPQRCAQHNILK
ncbi:unnamed protein product [Trifolium pratense]|uniref:Uncharacterized protein n=1 Tax=Trifolium pratense TaxID=57577 RepID=A0ACB0LZK2_TRIPR|nr:unnamed protein product [Trifolium pratense]